MMGTIKTYWELRIDAVSQRRTNQRSLANLFRKQKKDCAGAAGPGRHCLAGGLPAGGQSAWGKGGAGRPKKLTLNQASS